MTITTNTEIIRIEVDLGSKPVENVEAKIQGFQQRSSQEGLLIYFTTSPKIYFYFSAQYPTRLIYLHSPSLSQDLQRIVTKNKGNYFINPARNLQSTSVKEQDTLPQEFAYPDNPNLGEVEESQFVSSQKPLPYYGKQDNSSSLNEQLSVNNDVKRQELIKLLQEGD